MRRLAALFLLTLCCALPLRAQEGTPLAQALVLAETDDWDQAYALVDANPINRDLVTWTRLRAGKGSFTDYAAFVAARPDWPGMDRLRARGEEAIAPEVDPADPAAILPPAPTPEAVLAYFGEAPPQTGAGALALARALDAVGQAERAAAVLAEGWTSLGLTDAEHDALLAAYPQQLAAFHGARADAMLWRWRTTDAARMLPLLDPGQRALAEARLAYQRRAGDLQARLAAVPVALRGDPGLAYDRFNWLADRGEQTEAVALLLERSASIESLGQPDRYGSWRRILARWEMREGRADRAYLLATRHHLTAGDNFVDLEWLAGYLSLRFLNKPQQALAHFQVVEANVESPISEGRAGYWVGRAFEALGNPTEAQAAYGRAARYQTSFYGLLAAEKLGLPLDPSLAGTETFPDWRAAPVMGADLTRAAFALLAANQRGSAVLFFARLGQTLGRTEIGQVGTALDAINEPFFELLVGKAAVERDIIIPALYFPLHDLAAKDLPVAPELALSIARRESEFNAVVGSPVGALGLMQLMPATAEEVAAQLGLPYSQARLTADWDYNATLGSAYLRGLQDRFGDSPVMIAAGYNAGPSRPAQWIDDRGDPRLGEVDVIDWIEAIPFRETQNYVQRVTESIPVYRARLTGETGPVRFTELLVGIKPLLRPQARPEPAATPVLDSPGAADAPVAISTQGAASPAASLRPQARPGG